MKLLSIPNLTSTATTEEEPWAPGSIPAKAPVFRDKATYRNWCSQKTTNWYFLSPVEGSDKYRRVNHHNPAVAIRAVIGDWDCAGGFAPKDLTKFNANLLKGRFRPTVVHHTPSGGIRAIWMLEEAIEVDEATTVPMMHKLAKELKLEKLIHGFDKASLRPEQTFAFMPTNMTVDAQSVIPVNSLVSWKAEVIDSISFVDEARDVALEIVAEEIEKQYPGRWPGQFCLGSRGPRFWSPNWTPSHNPSAAKVASNGFICYSGSQSFVPWSQVLGKDFVAQFAENQFGEAVKGIYSDGRQFWLHYGWGWGANNADAVGRELRSRGLSAQVLKGEETSELMRAVNFIEQQQKVAGRAPFLYRGDVVKDKTGLPYLNTAVAKALKPAAKGSLRECPVIYGFLREIFPNRKALRAFIAWLKRAYMGAYNLKPKIGHCVVLCGPAGIGKTFLTNRILGALMGGFADCTDVILKGSRFNDLMLKNGVAVIDDGGTADTEHSSTKLAENVKKIVAQHDHVSEAKFESKVKVEWFGRLVFCCNDDVASLMAIPTLTTGTDDKICLFRMSPPMGRGCLDEKSEEAVAKELPAFARWLIEVDSSKFGLEPDARYGFKPHIDPSLRNEVEASSPVGEALREALDLFFESNPEVDKISGSATKIRGMLEAADIPINGSRAFEPITMGRSLSRMASAGIMGIDVTVQNGTKKYWVPSPSNYEAAAADKVT